MAAPNKSMNGWFTARTSLGGAGSAPSSLRAMFLGVAVAIYNATSTTINGFLAFSTAVSRIVPGATSLSLRNNANAADNLLMADAGNGLFRNFQHNSAALFMNFGTETLAPDSANAPAAAAWLGGVIRQVPTTGRTLTTDTAANIDTAITGVQTGDTFQTYVHNNSAGANAITLAAGSGVTFFPASPGTIAQNKTASIEWLRTGAGAWNAYIMVGA